MRVLMSTPYDLAVPGGVNQQALGLVEALSRRGVSVKLIGPSSGPVDRRNDRIQTLGSVSSLNRNGAISRVALDPRVIGKIRQILREFNPTVIHIHEPVVPLIGPSLLAMAGSHVRRVGTFHTYSEGSRGYLWAWPWCHWIWSRLDVRVAVSPAAREFATRYHRANFRTIPNGIDDPKETKSIGIRSDRLQLLFVGRMDEERKGFGVLVEAFRRLPVAEIERVQLTVVGRGSERWRKQTNELPIVYKGELSDRDREQALTEADAIVLPSIRGESFGVVGLESMIRGLPVIASRLPAYREWMQDAAIYFRPNDSAELAETFRQLILRPELLAKASSDARACAQKFRWANLVQDWIDLYRDRASPKGSGIA